MSDEMSDLDICKRIAEIEGVRLCTNGNWWCSPAGCCNPSLAQYDPLVDDALCFQLMIKYKVSVLDEYYTGLCDTWVAEITDQNSGYSEDEKPNKAICLAIIEANK